MKYHLMDEASCIDVAGTQVYITWQRLEPIIKAIRDMRGPSASENFEYAAVKVKLWLDKHPNGYYPVGTPRMEQLEAAADTKEPR